MCAVQSRVQQTDGQICLVHCIFHVIFMLSLLCCVRHLDLFMFFPLGGLIVKSHDLSNKCGDKFWLLCSGLHARKTNVLKESNKKSCLCFQAHLFKSWKKTLLGQFLCMISLMISCVVFFPCDGAVANFQMLQVQIFPGSWHQVFFVQKLGHGPH